MQLKFYLLLHFLGSIYASIDDRYHESIFEAIENLIIDEDIGCYSTINFPIPYGNSHNYDDDGSLEKTCSIKPYCCNVVIKLGSITTTPINQSMSLSFFRKYIIVFPYSHLQHLSYDADNVRVLSFTNNHYGLFEKLSNVWKIRKIWHGSMRKWVKRTEKPFWQSKQLRVACFMMPPYSEIWTYPNGSQWTGQGLEMSFLKEIANHDEFKVKWIDVLHEEGDLWGGIMPNGTSTGQAKLLYEYRADTSIGEIFCGFKIDYLHRISCSYAHTFDGFLTLIQKRKQPENWLGIVTPYTWRSWLFIGLSLFATTLVIMFHNKLTTDKIDIIMHFLDALNPMAGRPMSQPGFQAKRIKKYLQF